jgi:hypothetical protein
MNQTEQIDRVDELILSLCEVLFNLWNDFLDEDLVCGRLVNLRFRHHESRQFVFRPKYHRLMERHLSESHQARLIVYIYAACQETCETHNVSKSRSDWIIKKINRPLHRALENKNFHNLVKS